MKQFYFLKKSILGIIIAIVTINMTYAYNSLWLNNPHSTDWRSDQGTIEEATFKVTPKGLYMECQMELTFSARGTIFNSSTDTFGNGTATNDTIELSLYFNLPEGSMITQAHLLIEDSLVKARLMDRWAATQIYENIVKRIRRDPLILYKEYGNQYFMRIYPMAAAEQRKAIITYLIPASFTKNYASIELPTDILNVSKNKIKNITINVFPADDWKNPVILEIPDAKFKNRIDTELGVYQKIEIKHEGETFSSLSLGFDSPMKNGLYVNTYDTGNEGYYQMAFLPSQVLDISNSKKVAIVIDYESNLTYVSASELLHKLEKSLKEYFTEDDYFNLIYHDGTNIKLASDNWIQATENNIDITFNSMVLSNFPDTNIIEFLVPEAITFMSNFGEDGKLLLVTSSNSIKDNKEADEIIESMKKIMDPLPQINIINMMEIYWYWWNLTGEYYYGNDYFYSELARATGGEYYKLDYTNTIGSVVTKMFQSFDGYIDSYDMHTTMDDGFCHSRYNKTPEHRVFVNKPIVEVGKYYGSFPFEIEISALTDDGVFMGEFSFNKSAINIDDTCIEQAWVGNYIENLENSYYNYQNTQEIIDNSLEYHVLSRYTAFLALEPGMSYEVPDDITTDGGDVTRVESLVANDFAFVDGPGITTSYGDENGKWYVEDEYIPTDKPSGGSIPVININAYPNPFINDLSLEIAFNQEIDLSQVQIKISNLSGQVVRTFSPANLGKASELEISWNGKGVNGRPIIEGTYVLSVIAPNANASIQLLKVK